MQSQLKEDLLLWIQQHEIECTFSNEDRILTVPGLGNLVIINGDNVVIREIEKKGCLDFSDDEWLFLKETEIDIDYYLFQFGTQFFYSSTDEDVEFNLFKYVGSNSNSVIKAPFLGIHTAFELCNGSKVPGEWVKKAKFLGVDTLGICDLHTLGGVLSFQDACKKGNIKSVIGESFIVVNERGVKSSIKLYVQNQTGWTNLLVLSNIVNVENQGKNILITSVAECNEGLICVLSTDFDFNLLPSLEKDFEGRLYYQLDLCEWDGISRDEQYINNFQLYRKEYSHIPPVLINDAFYLDKQDARAKKILNSIGKVGFQSQSKDQYFKTAEQAWQQIEELCGSDKSADQLYDLFDQALSNVLSISKNLDFTIPTGQRHLPSYKMNEEEAAQYSNNRELFDALLEKGFQKLVIDKGLDIEVYRARLAREIDVLERGGVIDYFLIVADLVKWAESVGIVVGNGRGSAAGCLVSYLLNIVKIDPIHYRLLFERFLSESRIMGSMPDIDMDFMSSRRDEGKRYMESKYGKDFTTNIGSYNTFKLKATLTDLARYFGIDLKTTRYISGIIEDTEGNYGDLIKGALMSARLKGYVQENPGMIETFLLILNQPKLTSMHAAGVVLVPEQNGKIYEQMPVRKVDDILVSEWDGNYIDKTGFLKCDLLALSQLDKFYEIMELIQANTGTKIDLFNIPLDDDKVYELFQEGHNQDVFQFGGGGLKSYCKQLKPENIEDLIATVALYRPGPIDVGFHEKYIKLKNGELEPTYYTKCEDILKTTYSVICYQEQIMQIVQTLGGFTLVEADDIRKAMGKKIAELMESYKGKFITGAIANGAGEEEAAQIWSDMEGFAGYAFNRSHAACYAIMGYYSQWFKANYPLEFWTVSLQHSKDDNLLNRVAEMHRISNIELAPPDINKSQIKFVGDPETLKIYWSINSIKQAGAATIAPLFEERQNAGDFFSIEDFCDRVKVRRNALINMIICGVFDEIENVKEPNDRFKILEKFLSFTKSKTQVDVASFREWKAFQWTMKQKELCGYGNIDFTRFILNSKKFSGKKRFYRTNAEIVNLQKEENDILAVGIVQDCIISKTKKGDDMVKLTLDDGTQLLQVMVWKETFQSYQETFLNCRGNILMLMCKSVLFNSKIGFQMDSRNGIVELVLVDEIKPTILPDVYEIVKIGTLTKTADGKSHGRSITLSPTEGGEDKIMFIREDAEGREVKWEVGKKITGLCALSGTFADQLTFHSRYAKFVK